MKRDYHVDIKLSPHKTENRVTLSVEAKGLRDDDFIDAATRTFQAAAEQDKGLGLFVLQMGLGILVKYVENGTVKGDELDHLLSTLYELIDDKNEVMKELRRNGRQE